MTSYYQEFVPGFNAWYAVAAALVLLSMYVGTRQYKLSRSLKVVKTFNDAVYVLGSVTSGALVGALIFAESFRGVVQWFDNRLLAGESAAWSVLLAVLAIVFVTTLYTEVVYNVGKIAGWATRSYLSERRREIIAEERRRAREAERLEREMAAREAEELERFVEDLERIQSLRRREAEAQRKDDEYWDEKYPVLVLDEDGRILSSYSSREDIQIQNLLSSSSK